METRHDHVYEFAYGHQKPKRIGGLAHDVCNACHTSVFTREQMDENRAKVKAVQATIPGFISPEQILELRERHQLTQVQAGELFGCGSVMFSKYERGLHYPSKATAELMLSCLHDDAFMMHYMQVRKEVDASTKWSQSIRGYEGILIEAVHAPAMRVIDMCDALVVTISNALAPLQEKALVYRAPHRPNRFGFFHQTDESFDVSSPPIQGRAIHQVSSRAKKEMQWQGS